LRPIRPIRHQTIADIAAAAGVSKSTASRVISGRGYASDEARTRVLKVVDRVGYVPNELAQSLKTRASRAVGVVISDLTNSFYAQVASGIEEVLRANGYRMVVCNTDGVGSEERNALRTLQSIRVEGVILTPSAASTNSLRNLVAQGVVVVEVDRQTTPASCDAVLVSNEDGAYIAVSHLLRLGHRQVGILVGETTLTTGAGRLAGYKRALLDAGVKPARRLISVTSFHGEGAQSAAGQLLDGAPEMTAVFAANNVLAEGLFRELRVREYRIPRDISMVAFDDLPWMEYASPGISTMAQPTRELGREAANVLLARLRAELTSPPVTRMLPTRFVERSSTGSPREGGVRESAEQAGYEGIVPLLPEDVAEFVALAVSRQPQVDVDELVVRPVAYADPHFVALRVPGLGVDHDE